MKLAFAPLKVTAVVPEKPVPVMVILAPATPLGGEKLVIVGGTMTGVGVGVGVLVAVLVGVLVAVGVTVGVGVGVGVLVAVLVGVLVAVGVTVGVGVGVGVLVAVLAGVLVAVGVGVGAATVKLLALVAVPPGVVTAITPVVAPDGTVAVI